MAGTTQNERITTANGSDLRQLEIQHNNLVQDVENLRRQVTYMMPGAVLTAPASGPGTSDAAEWGTAAFTFTFRGLIVSAVAAETALTATTHDVAASKEAWFVLTVQTDGTTFTITKAADQTIGTVLLPTAPDNEVIVAYMGIVTGTTGFDATTDDLEVSGQIITSITFTDAPGIAASQFTAAKIANQAGTVLTSAQA